MAKQTFLNLKPEKQKRFKSAVYQLFASRGYEEIGIRDITDAAGIALGGFYRYFDDKDEMYLDLFAEIETRLVEQDIFSLEEDNYLREIQDVKDAQKILTLEEMAFGETFYRLPETVLYKYYFQGYAERIYKGYLDFFTRLEKRGSLKEGIDHPFAFYYFITSFFNFICFLRRNNMNTNETVFRLKNHFIRETVMPGLIKPEELPRIYRA
ncbi:MAG: TetR/AcrR family transcriptional regulator [Anaerolineaceae bacterium]|nr:TetR/AcrR family transcriptional regulator [Anaerolineaceae bacterium]